MTVIEEIVGERDKMIARSRRGIAKDDGKNSVDWMASLRKATLAGYEPRHMWIKVAAVALRAVEAIDRRST